MTKLPFALSTLSIAFALSACIPAKQPFRECDGPAGHAEMVDKNRYNGTGDDIVLIYDEKNGKHHEYRLDINVPDDIYGSKDIHVPNSGIEGVVGESAVPLTCATGKPDARWKEIAPK